MTKPGRPNLLEADKPELVEMAERWCAGQSGISIRKTSRIVVGLEAPSPHTPRKFNKKTDAQMKPKPSSKAKRLERRFQELQRSGEALAISVYRVLNQERLLQRKRVTKPSSASVEDEAIRLVALRCKLSEDDVTYFARRGREILEVWFPEQYSPVVV